MTSIRYPIGEFLLPATVSHEDRVAAIAGIAALPEQLRGTVAPLSEEHLDTPYRSGGWTVRQVVHHLPDSHINAYTRMRLALTEELPTIRTYEEARWAELADSQGDVEMSLQLLAALHKRWVFLLERLQESQLSRRLMHPEMGELTVDVLVSLYAWHGRHHLAHITKLHEQKGWSSISSGVQS